MRLLLLLALSVVFGGCASTEYKDTNAAVDANPLCASQPDRPGDPVAKECERTRSVELKSNDDSHPIDFGGKPD